ncbi:Sodium-dependent phosphate transporter [Operophtera brumata]|uniref:Sodium-dependent phosphate transporter n=1 Tax=Operophtera brumata TaxID=104452 RepID=A0A0L7KX47_OPEBR|nr:Sodium-dependent phosphate transporter [Operophtera brumata]
MCSEKEINVDELKPKPCLGIRHLQSAMLFLAMLLAYGMRVNMSMAIVAMTDSESENSFDWSMQTQSVILSSFFWGYIILQIPAGELAAKFGGSVLITISLGVNSAVVLQGLSQGFTFPSTNNLIGKWVPLEERSRLGTIIYAGGQLGTALQLIASGFIAQYWGWPAIFYVNGCLGATWTVLYVFLGSNSPQSSRMISQEEKLYIQTSLGHVGEQKAWGFWTLMTEIPSYLKQVLGVDINFPFGFVSDWVLAKKYFSITTTRKLSNSIGMFGPAVALIGLTYSPAGNVMMAVALLTILVHIDMAPNFAGTLMGITNCIANMVSINAPLVAGAILKDDTDAGEWRKVFYISSGIFIAGNVFYLIFGTSERQKWNDHGTENRNGKKLR